MSSEDSDGLTGAFMVVCPESGRRLGIIASNGRDWNSVALPGEPWEHVSVSVDGSKKSPSWVEMVFVKGLFWDDEECVVEFHPPRSSYVNNHPGVLHLWRSLARDFPMPPQVCV